MNVCLKDCFLSVNFFCSSKKICSEGITCPCVTVAVQLPTTTCIWIDFYPDMSYEILLDV